MPASCLVSLLVVSRAVSSWGTSEPQPRLRTGRTPAPRHDRSHVDALQDMHALDSRSHPHPVTLQQINAKLESIETKLDALMHSRTEAIRADDTPTKSDDGCVGMSPQTHGRVALFGERHSGTNLMERLIAENFRVNATGAFGFKHWWLNKNQGEMPAKLRNAFSR